MILACTDWSFLQGPLAVVAIGIALYLIGKS